MAQLCLHVEEPYIMDSQGRREVGGGPGQIFFRGPYYYILLGPPLVDNFFR